MVDVAQLVEPRIVIPVVVGSNPIIHPTFLAYFLFLDKTSPKLIGIIKLYKLV